MLGWLVLLIGLLTAAGTLGARFDSSFSIPGTPAQVALDTMEQRFGSTSNNATLKVIFTSPSGDISADEPAVDAVVSALGHAPGVSAVQSPFESSVDARGEAISNDGSMAYATVTLNSPASAVSDGDWEAIRSSVDTALGSSGLQVAYSGMPDPQSAGDQTEAIGLLLSLVVLTITFGSLLAAGMPLVTAGIGVALTSALITVASNLATLSATTPGPCRNARPGRGHRLRAVHHLTAPLATRRWNGAARISRGGRGDGRLSSVCLPGPPW